MIIGHFPSAAALPARFNCQQELEMGAFCVFGGSRSVLRKAAEKNIQTFAVGVGGGKTAESYQLRNGEPW